MKTKETFVVRSIMGQYVFMPTGNTAIEFSGMIIASETAAFIWDHIEEVNSPEEMAELIVAEYEVSYEEALEDVKIVFDNFQKAGWIE